MSGSRARPDSFYDTYERFKQAAETQGKRDVSRAYRHRGQETPPEFRYTGLQLTREKIITDTGKPPVQLACDVTLVRGETDSDGYFHGIDGLSIELGMHWTSEAPNRPVERVRLLGRIGSARQAASCDAYWRAGTDQPDAQPLRLQWYDDVGQLTQRQTPDSSSEVGRAVIIALSSRYNYREPFEPILQAIAAGQGDMPTYNPVHFQRLAHFMLEP